MNSDKDVNEWITNFEPSIKRIAYWYLGLWPKGWSFDTEDLISAGREGVWQVYEKRPEKLEYEAYV
ncbi:hypothetical protein COU53_01730 [Candidatus Pacearchaeota archaeon CG10_big_fil_rev_8_21_14_0_10_30_48]|nr:MAG: hypothetical protein COU53_01730 [Candidatus Pacearchaeota archaeon CG10_big_fil_rev_8_21_14_0_10_30_48]